MNCSRFEQMIALHVEGDLPEADAARLEAHLETCAECREVAADLRASQEALKMLGAEAVDEADLAVIRRQVLNRIGDRQPRLSLATLFRWAAPAAAAAALALWLLPDRSPVELPRPEIAHAPVPVLNPPPARRETAKPRALARQRTRRPRAVQAARRVEPAGADPLVVKLLTPDPDVVIYWIIEKQGDSE